MDMQRERERMRRWLGGESAARLEVLEPAPGAYRVRDPQANWPRDDVAVYHYRSGAWACERDSDAWAGHPCEHIRACQQQEERR